MKVALKERNIEKEITEGEEIITDIDYIKAITILYPNFEHIIESIEQTLQSYVKTVSNHLENPCKVKVSKRKSSIKIEFFYTARPGIQENEQVDNRNTLIFELKITPNGNLATRCTDAQFKKKEEKIVSYLYQTQEIYSGKTGDKVIKNIMAQQKNWRSEAFEEIKTEQGYDDQAVSINTNIILGEVVYRKDKKITDIDQYRERFENVRIRK